jgi:hypothetical protein
MPDAIQFTDAPLPLAFGAVHDQRDVALVSIPLRHVLRKELSVHMKDYTEESEEGSDNVMDYSKGLLQLPWAFSCRPSTAVPGPLAYNSEERLGGQNNVS